MSKESIEKCISELEGLKERCNPEEDVLSVFHQSYLNLLQSLLEKEVEKENKVYKLILVKNKNTSPSYVTVCTKPKGYIEKVIMLTSSIYQATKFSYSDTSIDNVINQVKSSNPEKEVMVVEVSKAVFDVGKYIFKEFKEGDRVYHKNLELYGTFVEYNWLTKTECHVLFDNEDGFEDCRNVSVNMLELIK